MTHPSPWGVTPGQEYRSAYGVQMRVYSVDRRANEVTVMVTGLPDDAEFEVGDLTSMRLSDFEDDIRHEPLTPHQRKFGATSGWWLEKDVPQRNWCVSWGYYCDRHAYRGPSTFLAGLNHARACRSGCPHDPAGRGHDVLDMDTLDEDGDDQTDEEREFFDRCEAIGAKYKWRESWDHSKNWKTPDERARRSANPKTLGEYVTQLHVHPRVQSVRVHDSVIYVRITDESETEVRGYDELQGLLRRLDK